MEQCESLLKQLNSVGEGLLENGDILEKFHEGKRSRKEFVYETANNCLKKLKIEDIELDDENKLDCISYLRKSMKLYNNISDAVKNEDFDTRTYEILKDQHKLIENKCPELMYRIYNERHVSDNLLNNEMLDKIQNNR